MAQLSDILTMGTASGVRIYATRTTNLTRTITERHKCSHVASAALGRAMAGALLFAATMKEGERVGLRFKGDGPIGEVVADAENFCVRGYVGNPDVYLPPKNGKLDVGGAVGAGTITVTRYRKNAAPFTGYANLVSGEIANDLTSYLYTSEQTPSSVALGVLVAPSGQVLEAGGYFIQALPDCDEHTLDILDANVRRLPYVSQMLELGYGPEKMIELLGRGLETHILETKPVQFKCRCSRERVLQTLATLPAKDLQELGQDAKTEVHCPFCNETYLFSKEEIQALAQAE